jgi:hypothetical protein
MKKNNEHLVSVNTKEDLSRFVAELVDDFKLNGESWENNNIADFLEAMSAWIFDMDGYYLNQGLPVSDQPSWSDFARILLAAKYYE